MLWTIVDEVDKMLGVGPEIFEDLEDFVKTGKQPFDHVYEALLCMSYSSLLSWHRNHDEMVATLVGCLHFLLVDTCIVHDPTSL